MNDQDYHTTITILTSPKEVFTKIGRVSGWWAQDFEGKSEKINDEFSVRFMSGDMYRVKIRQVIPDQKIVWEVIDSYQGWHPIHSEWTGTNIIWEVIPDKKGAQVKMTHQGLVPEFECYDRCKAGWDYLIEKSLQKFLNEDEGLPV